MTVTPGSVLRKTAMPARDDMDLRAKVAQLLVVHLSRDIPVSPGEVEALFDRYPVGAIFAGGEVIEDGSNSLAFVREQVERCRRASPIPLLVSADLENGGGDVIPGLTPLPFPMALGAANDSALARKYGQACAREGALAGINWALAPMADLNLHPLSSNVGTRAFGDSAVRVTPLLEAFVAGMQDEGMAACAKTFPGDGSDYRDQHLVCTENRLSREDWEASYGHVFQSLIDRGVASVMTGHLSLAAFQQEREHGLPPPCTISRELTTGLLKETLGFKGVVVTDAFGMGGIRSWRDPVEGAVEAFAAGADMVLWPGLAFIDRVVEAITSGSIPESRLEDALERIWRMKEVFAVADPVVCDDATPFAEAVARETADRAVTLLWNRNRMLPLRADETPRLLLVGTTPHEKAFQRFALLKKSLEDRGFETALVRHIKPEEIQAMFDAVDRVIFLVERQFHRPLGPMELFGEEARNLWSACMHAGEKTVAIGFGSPYLVPWYFDRVPAALNVYSAVPACQAAAVRALTGELEPRGTMPVSWEGRTSIRSLGDLCG